MRVPTNPGAQEPTQEVTVLSWNLLLDDLISNFIPRTL